MARTSINPTDLFQNGSVATDPSATVTGVGAGNGVTIANAFPEQTIFRVNNAGGASLTASVVAGAQPLAIASGQGPLTVTVAAGATAWIGPVESGRFEQSDGSLALDTSAAANVTAFRVRRH